MIVKLLKKSYRIKEKMQNNSKTNNLILNNKKTNL